jgi:hypothetical protein
MPESHTAKPTPVSNDPIESLVGEFVEEKAREIREEKARRVPRKRSPFVMPLLMVLCAGVWVAPSLMLPREPELSPQILERSARLNLYLASLSIRKYQTTYRQLPATLEEAGVDTAGVVYSRNSNGTFELSSDVLGARMIYQSTQPDSVFLGADLRVSGVR